MKCEIEIQDVRVVGNTKHVTVKCTSYNHNREYNLVVDSALVDNYLVAEVRKQMVELLTKVNPVGQKFTLEV